MESTETNNAPLSMEDAVAGILAPTEEATETVEEETQVTEEELEEVEASAESDIEEEVSLDSEDDDEIEIEASDMDDEDNDYEENAVQDEVLDTYSVKVDGQVKEVTLEELKQGYSGQEYVQKGMQEASRQRKEAEAVFQALQDERKQVAELLQQMQGGSFARPPEEPSKELFERDPIGYMEEKMNYEDKMKEYNKQMSQVNSVMQQQTEAEKQAQQVYLKKEMEQLQKVIPEFSDPNKAKTIRDKLVTNGSNYYGYSAEEIGMVMDHRAIRVLNDAIKYREIMEGKNKAVKKASKKRVVKAGAKKVDDSTRKIRQKQMAKFKQSGNINDAVSLIMNS